MYTSHSELDSKSDLEIFYKICIDLEILEDTGYSPYTNLTLNNKDEFIYKRFEDYYLKYKSKFETA